MNCSRRAFLRTRSTAMTAAVATTAEIASVPIIAVHPSTKTGARHSRNAPPTSTLAIQSAVRFRALAQRELFFGRQDELVPAVHREVENAEHVERRPPQYTARDTPGPAAGSRCVTTATTMVTTAPGMPTGLRYGRTMLGMFLRSTMNDSPCIAYEIIAPNTAMLSSVPPMIAPPFSDPQRRTTGSSWSRSRAPCRRTAPCAAPSSRWSAT